VTGGIVDAGTLHQRPASDAEMTGRSPRFEAALRRPAPRPYDV